MKKYFIKISILVNVIIFIICGNSVQAVNNASNSSNVLNKNNLSSNITSTSVAGTSNANLSNLGTKKYDFTGFKPDDTSYDITIPENVTEVEVYAKTQDSQARYTVSGDKNLKIGSNKVIITVTAADGKTKKEYYIMVRRLGNASENENENENSNQEINEEQTNEENEQSNITRYSTPHKQYGWYIIGILLLIVTILLIVFIIIDDKKGKSKIKKQRKVEDNEDFLDEEKYNFDETRIMSDEDIKRINLRYNIDKQDGSDNKKGRHF